MFIFKIQFFLLSVSIASDVNFSHLLMQYCSKSLNCPRDNLGNENTTDTEWDKCCGKCSCDEQCGQTQSCCLVEDNVQFSRRHGKECIEPYVGAVSHFQQIGGHGVVMVTQCLNINKECKYKNGIVNVNPVESSTSEVFINKECAQCNNVSTFVPWTSRIVSGGKHLYSFRNIQEPTINAETIIYEPPKKFTYPECYSSFLTVNISQCPNDLYRQACSSTVLPYFTNLGTFQNVFCYLCIYSKRLPCYSMGDRVIPGTFSLFVNSTLDTTAIASYFAREHMLGNKEKCQEGFMPHPSRVGSFHLK